MGSTRHGAPEAAGATEAVGSAAPSAGNTAVSWTARPAGVAGGTGATAIDHDTGQAIGGTGGGADSVSAIPVSLSNQLDPTIKLVLIVVACALLLGLTVGPPLIARMLNKGDRR